MYGRMNAIESSSRAGLGRLVLVFFFFLLFFFFVMIAIDVR